MGGRNVVEIRETLEGKGDKKRRGKRRARRMIMMLL